MTADVIIFAPNVGSGGGLVLLHELMHAAWPDARITAILDRRGQQRIGRLDRDHAVHWVTSSVMGRWQAERLLSRLTTPSSLVLCFHNLPPVLPSRGHVVCYVQNAHLVGLIPSAHLSGWVRIRCLLERVIARRFRHRIHRYIVQTPTMAAALRDWCGDGSPPIDVLPFAPDSDDMIAPVAQYGSAGGMPDRAGLQWDFLYVSDGSAHKNHHNLFAAWSILAQRGLRPSLAVTLHPGRDQQLRRQVKDLAVQGMRIEDLGQIPHSDVLAAYRRAGALIFPSYAESFGIPLIEARAAGLPILAPELDYVRDVCEPVMTFDAASARSIARAVERFLGAPADPIVPMPTARFVDALCDRHMGINA